MKSEFIYLKEKQTWKYVSKALKFLSPLTKQIYCWELRRRKQGRRSPRSAPGVTTLFWPQRQKPGVKCTCADDARTRPPKWPVPCDPALEICFKTHQLFLHPPIHPRSISGKPVMTLTVTERRDFFLSRNLEQHRCSEGAGEYEHRRWGVRGDLGEGALG